MQSKSLWKGVLSIIIVIILLLGFLYFMLSVGDKNILTRSLSALINEHPRAWTLMSQLDKTSSGSINQEKSILNLAMPSGDTTYVITVVPKGKTYLFDGFFPTERDGVLYSSLSVYDKKGLLVKNDQGEVLSWNRLTRPVINDVEVTAEDAMFFVIQRFYRASNTHTIPESKWLTVSDKNGQLIKTADHALRDYLSNKVSERLLLVMQKHSKQPTLTNTGFYMPDQLAGLFPNYDAGYAIATPAKDVKYVKVTGVLPSRSFAQKHHIVYLSFMAVNYQSTATDASISFQRLGGFKNTDTPYVFYILNPHVSRSSLHLPLHAVVLTWKESTVNDNARGVVFRLLATKPSLMIGKTLITPQSLSASLGKYTPKIQYF